MRRSKTTKLKPEPKPKRAPVPKGVKSLGSVGDGKRVLEIEARAVQALVEGLGLGGDLPGREGTRHHREEGGDEDDRAGDGDEAREHDGSASHHRRAASMVRVAATRVRRSQPAEEVERSVRVPPSGRAGNARGARRAEKLA